MGGSREGYLTLDQVGRFLLTDPGWDLPHENAVAEFVEESGGSVVSMPFRCIDGDSFQLAVDRVRMLQAIAPLNPRRA